jgi:hypothetical protein
MSNILVKRPGYLSGNQIRVKAITNPLALTKFVPLKLGHRDLA